jgi:hypothetical protein
MRKCKYNQNCELQDCSSNDDKMGPTCTAIDMKCDDVKGCPYKLDKDLFIL